MSYFPHLKNPIKLFKPYPAFLSGKHIIRHRCYCSLTRAAVERSKLRMKLFTQGRRLPLIQVKVSTCTLHTSETLSNPRFKLDIEHHSKRNANEKQNEEDTGKEDQSYLKSHPYRQLNPWKSKSELAAHLVDNVIYHDHGLFVTNKPFGVGVRKRTERRRIVNVQEQQLHLRGLDISSYCLEDLLPELRHMLKKPDLVLVKSTEKLTSGAAIFAEDEDSAKRCSKAIKSSKGFYHENMFTYHIVTTLVPLLLKVDEKEVVGVTIQAFAETNQGQPVLTKEYSINSVKRGDVKAIHVRTKPLTSGQHGGCLVEVGTLGIQNNFLRLHCADKLAPILGDNLYSERVRVINGIPTKINPSHLTPGSSHQRLSMRMVEMLNLKKPEDSVIIPAHIHLRSYRIYNYLGKRSEMKFESPYPPYFKWTCARLGIVLDADMN